ncbi:hypothetical protein B9G53_01065 [Pseudanabaena sp. SR411]|uniref:hypothetical protein n=1 Tax=Pseudanabaena sp. SR411 TaxID=1980935 RepID=UPI000B981D86|nr:hypothetical protein [Pseudanabaena sp. SR411]OYQ67573.1 hypothetical protein B9G53_01065 [Pseudanabaena sp. SR411]
MELKRKIPPNPNGNPNFKRLWDNLGEAKAIRLPESLHSLFRSLSTAINSGKVKTTDLENMCIDWGNVERELTAITGKPSLSIVQNPEKSNNELLEKLEQFEAAQRATWGTLPQHRGEFSTTSARWGKYNEFKAWLANQGE